MYGLLLENICQYTCRAYGNHVWDEIRKLAQIKEPTFSIHTVYPDNYVVRITAFAVQVIRLLSVSVDCVNHYIARSGDWCHRTGIPVSDRQIFRFVCWRLWLRQDPFCAWYTYNFKRSRSIIRLISLSQVANSETSSMVWTVCTNTFGSVTRGSVRRAITATMRVKRE